MGGNTLKNIVGVRFRRLGKIYFFNPQYLILKKDELIIVDTDEGEEIGRVAIPNRTLDDEKVPKELIRHFIRGYFDGDGSLCVTEKTRSIDVLGTYDFLYQLCLESGIDTNKIYVSKSKSNKVFRIVLGSKSDLYNFSKYMYDDCNIYLDRKYEKFKKLMEYYN